MATVEKRYRRHCRECDEGIPWEQKGELLCSVCREVKRKEYEAWHKALRKRQDFVTSWRCVRRAWWSERDENKWHGFRYYLHTPRRRTIGGARLISLWPNRITFRTQVLQWGFDFELSLVVLGLGVDITIWFNEWRP